VPADVFVANQPQASTEPVRMVDAKVLPQSILIALRSGQFNNVPTMVGSTQSEDTLAQYVPVVAYAAHPGTR
jgi:hypothetical protein